MRADPVEGRGEEARDAILKAAVAELGDGGAHGFRVEQVAERAGVSLGLMYYYFGNRLGLLREALLRALGASALGDGTAPSGFDGAMRLPASRVAGAEGRTASALVYEDAIRAAVFSPEFRPAVARTVAQGERDIAAEPGGPDDPEFAAVILALADGLQQRVRSGILPREDALRLLADGGRLFGAESAG